MTTIKWLQLVVSVLSPNLRKAPHSTEPKSDAREMPVAGRQSRTYLYYGADLDDQNAVCQHDRLGRTFLIRHVDTSGGHRVVIVVFNETLFSALLVVVKCMHSARKVNLYGAHIFECKILTAQK